MKVNDKVFDYVKQLQKSGIMQKQIGELMKISVNTVRIISHSESLSDYRETVRKRYKKKADKPEPVNEPVVSDPDVWVVTNGPAPIASDMKMSCGTMTATYYFNRMIDLLKKQNELLELLSNKLTFIVESLT